MRRATATSLALARARKSEGGAVSGALMGLCLFATDWSLIKKYSMRLANLRVCTARLLGRHDERLVFGYRVQRRFIEIQVRRDQFGRRMRQPRRERQILVDAGFKHLQKFQIGG